MNFETPFRWCMKISAMWIFLCVVGGAKAWKFPLPFKDAWEKQRLLLEQHWKE